jgi:hypothetical protein
MVFLKRIFLIHLLVFSTGLIFTQNLETDLSESNSELEEEPNVTETEDVSASEDEIPIDQEPLLVMVFPAIEITAEGAMIPPPVEVLSDEGNSESSDSVIAESESETNASSTPLVEEVNFSEIFTRSIQNEYQEAGYSVALVNSWFDFLEPNADVQGTLSVDYANEQNTDIAAVTFFQLEGRRLTIMVKAYDSRRKKLITANVSTGRNDLSALNIIDRMMVSILRDLAEEEEDLRFMKENPGTLTGTAAARIVFESDQEGMEVLLSGGQSLGYIEEGRLELPYQTLALGQTIEVLKRAPGFYEATQENVLNTQDEVFNLNPLYPKTFGTFFVEWNAQKLAGLNLGIRAYLEPDYTFLHLGIGGFVQSPAIPNSQPVIHQSTELMFGSYLIFAPSDFFRFSYSLGVGLDMTFFTSNNLPVLYDFFLNIASLQYDLNFKDFIIYARSDLKYYIPLNDSSLLQPGSGSTVPLAPLTLGVAFKW